jgi:hypothetical protein
MRQFSVAAILLVTVGTAGCGKYVRDQGRAPAQPVISLLQAASGADPNKFGSTLFSDVITNLTKPAPCSATSPCPTTYGDLGEVTMQLILKDPGQINSPSSPTDLNQVTFTRYHVAYRRTDGRNTPGVDVPYAFDGGATFTVPPSGNVKATFEIVRNDAKKEAPLVALGNSGVIIGTIADVTFYGRDQAGNDVAATGSIQIEFGNFGDPE